MAGETRRRFAIDRVSGAHVDFVESAEHIEQHHGDRSYATQAACVTKRDDVEPAAAPGAARDRAVLIAALSKVLTSGVVLFGRKWPAADAGRVSFYDANHAVDIATGHARPARDTHAG